ncbi:nuclear transport factor 2 family protein [Candidatus Uabimicrobium sp. HlEnr_7]|uniref:nuclear transport factor 2 family protein n=1 Tax=Candidatus Uabimicrobium helgolandensis TaxID=3095367 RepID=UPI0035585A6C
MKKAHYILVMCLLLCACSVKKENVSHDIEPFLNKYFTSWSNNNMQVYSSLFHEKAVIIYIKNGTINKKQNLNTFVKGQSTYLAKEVGNVRETMTSFTAKEDKKSASVVVKWLFEEKGHPPETGIDHFLLIRNKEKQWKIASLVWYKD